MKKFLSLALSFSIIISMLPAYAAESAMTRDELAANYAAVEQSVITSSKSQYGYASSSNSSTLSWAASYMMESYYHMYKNTGDRSYLKRLGEQFREALNHLNYDYGEDCPGWDCPNYSVSRMNDPDFNKSIVSPSSQSAESYNAWMRKFGSDSDHVAVENNAGITGGGLHIISGGGKHQGAKIDVSQYAAGKIYQLNISVKTQSGVPAQVYLVKNSTLEVIPTLAGLEYTIINSPSKWTGYALRFALPEDGSPVSIHLESADAEAEGDLYFDNAAFKQASQFQVHDTMVLAAGAKFVQAVYEDAALQSAYFEAGKTYKNMADEFLPMIEKMLKKWDSQWREVGEDMGVYIWPMDDSSSVPGRTLPHNQYIKTVCVMLPLYDVTENPLYLDRATRMLKFFKSKITVAGTGEDAYCYWNYYDPALENISSSHVEDISHGCLELDAALMGYERGIVFDDTDMKRIANGFVKMLWNGDMENPVLYNYLADDPSNSLYRKEMTSESNVRDWARLGKWNRNIPLAIVNYMFNHSPTSGHPTKMLAYAYAYPYIFNPLLSVRITKKNGEQIQTEGSEVKVTLEAALNSGTDPSLLDSVLWSVKKDSSSATALGSGKTVEYTPSGKGRYVISADISGRRAEYIITVDEKQDPPDGGTPDGGTPGGGTPGGGSSGGGTSGGGSSGGGSSGGGSSPSAPSTPAAPSVPSTPAAPSPVDKFTDVGEDAWYRPAVEHALEKGIMAGVSDTGFDPEGKMTRAMLAKVLHNMENNPAHSYDGKFSDVKGGEWYTDAVHWAAEKGLVGGYGNGKYGTNDNITREQLAVMLHRYAGSPSSQHELTFADAGTVSSWALDAMRWAVEKGIINGKGENMLAPKSHATRAEVAQMLKNYTEAIG